MRNTSSVSQSMTTLRAPQTFRDDVHCSLPNKQGPDSSGAHCTHVFRDLANKGHRHEASEPTTRLMMTAAV